MPSFEDEIVTYKALNGVTYKLRLGTLIVGASNDIEREVIFRTLVKEIDSLRNEIAELKQEIKNVNNSEV